MPSLGIAPHPGGLRQDRRLPAANLRDAERCPARAFKEMSGPPKPRYTRMTRANMGSPKGREPYGDRVPVVVAGVTTCQGGREGRPQGQGAQVIGCYDRKACGMQNAETVLGVLRDRGSKGLPCNGLYRQMFNRDLYLLAYGRIYANQGAMTPGASAETADGMSEDKIDDNRFLRLIKQMLKAGYLEDWKYHETLSGSPQGGVVSPILSNIYLHKLDVYVEAVLIPQYTRGKYRQHNPEYERIKSRIWRTRARGDRDQARILRRTLRQLPSGDPQDPGYRRLRYTRYADDHLLGFTGPKAEAEAIKDQLARFLRDELALELNPDKTLVTHARTRAARYLGYEIIAQHGNDKVTNGRRPVLQNLDDYDIVSTFGAEYRGIVGYYRLAHDVWRLNELRWHALTSWA